MFCSIILNQSVGTYRYLQLGLHVCKIHYQLFVELVLVSFHSLIITVFEIVHH